MTEIPEHLLARSKSRRQAIGQEEGGDADAPASPGTAVEAAAAGTPPAATGPAGVAAPTPARAPGPAAPPPPPPKRPEVLAAEGRKKIPIWAVPAVVALPFWAFMYAFTLEPPTGGALSPALTEGEHLYSSAGCSGCHGATGGGGVGPAFADGAVVETFADPNQHIQWVALGSDGWLAEVGNTYGDTAKPVGGGGNMPAFGASLTEEEIAHVVRFEREVLSGAECEPDLAELTGEACE